MFITGMLNSMRVTKINMKGRGERKPQGLLVGPKEMWKRQYPMVNLCELL